MKLKKLVIIIMFLFIISCSNEKLNNEDKIKLSKGNYYNPYEDIFCSDISVKRDIFLDYNNHLNKNRIINNIQNESLNEILSLELGLSNLFKNVSDYQIIVQNQKRDKDFIQETISFQHSIVGNFTAIILKPYSKNNATIIGLHGHGDNASVFKEKYMGSSLAKQGYIVAMPNFRQMNIDDSELYTTIKVYENGCTLLGFRIFESLIVIDYLKNLNFRNIGLLSHSGGSSTANLLLYLTSDIDSFVSDHKSTYNDLHPYENEDEELSVGCETIPKIYKYHKLINDFNNTNTPYLKLPYGFKDDHNEIIDFFKKTLLEN